MSQSLKEIAITFLKLASSGQVDEAFGTYVAANFKHHNAYYPGDATSLKEGMRENAETFPNKVFEVQRTIAEGNTVVVHSKVVMQMAVEVTVSVVHILRFEGDKIAELWDIGQPQPDDGVNENGLF